MGRGGFRLWWRLAWASAIFLTSGRWCAMAQDFQALLQRAKEIAPLLGEKPMSFGVPITNRPAWEALGKNPAFQRVLQSAEALLQQPIPDLPDDLYLDFSRTGNRTRWQSVNSRRQAFLNPLVFAECLENKGRFLPKLEELLRAFCAERTWVMPAHDGDLANFKGQRIDIDLKASARGWELASVLYLLGDRLRPELQALLEENLQRRIIQPFLLTLQGKHPRGLWWLAATHNWNAVCLAGVTGTALALLPSREERALFVAAAEHYIRNFLSGFTPDGYCSEGLGYWNYGFGNFVNLAEILLQATQGRIDLLAWPEAQAPARFGARIGILGGVYPAFADCSVNARPDSRLMWYLSRRLGLGLREWESQDPAGLRGTLFEALLYSFPNSASRPSSPKGEGPALRDWFDGGGVLIGRPRPGTPCRLGVALKGGHNAEHHNHNDLGSYVVAVGSTAVLLDPGAETYSARTFSARRYESKLLNSFGHPVPVVAGQLQRTGREAQAKVLRVDFTEDEDTLALDLTSAYPVPQLVRLVRTFVYSRRGLGALTVEDEAEFTEPSSFETALITLGRWRQEGPNRLFIWDYEEGVQVEVKAEGAALEFRPERIEEDAPVKPTRIGIRLAEPIHRAKVTVLITPLPPGDEGTLRNGGFEEDTLGWRIPEDGLGSLSQEQAASGRWSLKITDRRKDAGSDIASARIRAGAGRYEVRGKYFGVSGDGIGIYIRFLDAQGNLLNPVDERGFIAPVGSLGGSERRWRPFAFPFEAPEGTVHLQVWIHSYTTALVEGYLDDLEIVRR